MSTIQRMANSRLFIIMLILFALPVRAEDDGVCVDRIVGIVNDEVITLWELNEFSKPFFKDMQLRNGGEELSRTQRFEALHEFLNMMIDQKLAEQEAKRMGIRIHPGEVDATIEEIKRENHFTEEDLIALLKQEGLTMEEYRKKIENQLLKQRVLNYQIHSKIVVDEASLKTYYENHADEYGEKILLTLKHILITETDEKAMDMANKIYTQIVEGASFDDLARTYSDGPTAHEGGLLSPIDEADLDPALKEVISSMKEGEVSSPIITPIGIQIVKLIKREVKERKSFDEVKAQIYRKLLNEKINQRYREYLQELRSRAYIKITL